MTNNEDIKWLYGKLIGQGYDIGTEEEFTSSLSNSDDRDWYYNKAIKMGLDVGSKDEFDSLFAPQVPTPESKVTQTPQAPTAPSAPKVGSLNWYTAKNAGDAVKNVANNSALASATKAKNTEATDNLAKVKGTADVAQTTQGLINTTPIESKALELAQFKAKNKAMFDSMAQRTADMGEYYTKSGANVGKVVETAPEFNVETGEYKPKYITPTLNREENKAIADAEAREYKHWIDVQSKYVAPVNMTTSAQLRRVEERIADIDNKMHERAQQLIKEEEENKQSGFLGFLNEATRVRSIARSGMDREAYFNKDSDYQALALARRQLEDQRQQLQNKQGTEKYGERFWGDFGRGLWQSVSDIDTWDFGASVLNDAKTMSLINNKIENNIELTDAEANALEEIAESQAVKRYVGDLGSGYNWGSMTGQSLGFAAQMALTGGFSGAATGIGTKAASAVAKAAAKKIATESGKKIATSIAQKGIIETAKSIGKGGLKKMATEYGLTNATIATTRALGVGADILLVRAPLHTISAQGASLVGETVKSKYGKVVYDDRLGTLRFVNDKSWSEAAWQTAADKVIENASEMIGAHFFGLTDISKAFGARNLTAAILRATRENAGTVLSKTSQLLQRIGVNGYFGEVGEEYTGQLWRTMLNLESAKDDEGNNLIFSGKFNGDIWGGMAMSFGMMSSAALGANSGIEGVKYGVNTGMGKYWEHQVNKASAQASRVFSAEQWENMRQIIDATDNADMSVLAQQTIADNSLSESQKHAALTYMERSMNLRGYNLGRYMQSKNGMLDADAEAVNQSYVDGYESNDAQEMADARKAVEVEEAKLRSALSGIDQEGVNAIMAEVVADPVTAMQRAEDEALRDAIADYANAKAVYDGMQQRVDDDIDTQITVSDATIDRRTNRNTGKIQSVTLKNDKKVYVIGGTLNTTENGSVDFEHSDESIIVMDETGALEYSSPKNVLSIDNEIDPTEEKAISAETIRQQAQAQAEANMSGKLTFTAGEQVNLKQEDGTFLNGTIVGPYIEDGKVIGGLFEVETQDGIKLPFKADVLQTWADDARQARIEQFDADRSAEREQTRQAEQASEVVTEETAVPAEETPTEPQASALERVPTDEQGNPIYEQVDAETAWDAIVEQTQGDVAMAQTVANDMVKDKEKALKAAQNAKSKGGATIAEKIASEQERKANIQNAEQELAIWQAIASVPEARQQAMAEAQAKAEAERIKAEEAERVRQIKEAEEKAKAEAEALKAQQEAEALRLQQEAEAREAEERAKAITEAEEARRESLRQRAERWGKETGVKVHIMESLDDVKTVKARNAIKMGKRITGWYVKKTGEAYIYLPNIESNRDIDDTFVHEVVAHKGISEMLGKERFDALCDKVWTSMSEDAQKHFETYPGVKEIKDESERHRAAADEYMAHLAESTNLTEEEQGVWSKIVDFIHDVMVKLGFDTITDEDIQRVVRASYANLRKKNVGRNKQITESSRNLNNGTVRFSVATYKDWTDSNGQRHKGTREQVIDRMTKSKFSKKDISTMIRKMDLAYDYMRKLETLTDADGNVRFDEFVKWAETKPYYKQIGKLYIKAITSLVSNGDYPINLELTTDCIKREAFTHLLNELVKRGADISKMGPGEIVTIQKLMKQYGIEVACELCFVEGKRLQIVNWAQQIVNDWNDAIAEAGLQTDEKFQFGKDGDAFIPVEEWKDYKDKTALQKAMRAIDQVEFMFKGIDPKTVIEQTAKNEAAVKAYIEEAQEKWASKSKKPKAQWKPTDEQKREIRALRIEGLTPTYINENMKEYKEAYEQMRAEWVAGAEGRNADAFTPNAKQWAELDKIRNKQIDTVKQKMVRLIMEYPEMRKKMELNDLLGSKGLMNIRQQHGEAYEQLYSIILQRFGTGTPKPVQDAVPYDGEVMTLTQSKYDKANAIGGARLFSFSDFDITKVFDYMQMFFDLEANKQRLQSYTKEVAAILQFGRSNAKMNISTLAKAEVPESVKTEYKNASEAKQKELRHQYAENAGLKMNEDGTIAGINFSEEHSVSPEFAKTIFHDDTRNKDCGAIMVGCSVNHAIYSALQNWIRMVIPFHLSGMPIAAREKTDVLWYTDNTAFQSTRKKVDGGWKKISASEDTFSFYDDMDKKGWNMRDKTRQYLAWCEEHGYRPKFDWGINSQKYIEYCEAEGYTPNQQLIEAMDADTVDGVWNQYYKFLTDFTAYKPIFNEHGEMIDEVPSPQQAIVTNFDMTELEKQVLYEADDSMLAHRESNIDKTQQYIDEIADKVEQYLSGNLSEENMDLKEDVFYENNADAERYLEELEVHEGVRFRFLGENGAERLDHAEEASTRLDNLAVAREMESAGAEAKNIKMATGWERGADNKWRYETNDIKIKDWDWTVKAKRNLTLKDIIDDEELFIAYPSLANVSVKKTSSYGGGSYNKESNTIKVGTGILGLFVRKGADVPESTKNEVMDTLVHEIQHAIQHEEGFAVGGSPDMYRPGTDTSKLEQKIDDYNEAANAFNLQSEWYRRSPQAQRELDALNELHKEIQKERKALQLGEEGYHRLAGEVEAYNVGKRKDMTYEERLASLATETEDVAREDQLFIYDSLESEQAATGTAFSGGGLVEAGLKDLIDSKFAIEYDEKIAGVYRNNHGDHILVADIRGVDIEELASEVDGGLDYFHASPVCKRFSTMRATQGETALDIETAQATADIISEKQPKVVTIENVPQYKNSEAMSVITDALDANGYTWDANVYNSADYGAATSRRRLIVRAVKDGALPPMPQKVKEKRGWYEAVEDLVEDLPTTSLAPWQRERLEADGIIPEEVKEPLFVFDGGGKNGKARYAYGSSPLPTITASGSADRIVMPGGEVKLVSPRVLARIMGLPDSYQLPESRTLAHTILGNGVPVEMTEAVIAPMLEQFQEEDGIRFRASQTEIDEIAEEEAKIIAEAKENGTYLKAPNGKASKLSPEQWVQVRTSRFKEWFGDWELAYKKNYLLNGKAVSTLTGNEFSKVEGKTLTDQVEEFFNSIGNKAISPIYGEVILDRKGADDSLGHGMGRKKAVAYAAVKDVIENGIVIDYGVNHKDRGYDSAVIAAPIKIDGKKYICSVVITRMKDNRFYLHEVIEQEWLSNEGSNTAQRQPQRPKAFANILQNIVSASDDVSKVVDENGEPLVVYHGTNDGGFSIFNTDGIGKTRGTGAWFSDSERNASTYVKSRNYRYFESPRSIEELKSFLSYDDDFENVELKEEYVIEDESGREYAYDSIEELKEDGWEEYQPEDISKRYVVNTYYDTFRYDTEEELIDDFPYNVDVSKMLYASFLNIKNPYVYDADGKGWGELVFGSTDDVVRYARNAGHDGAIIKNVYDGGLELGLTNDYIAFEPNQIKSATDNEGTFSEEEDDIRFRVVEDEAKLAELESGDKITAYRAVQIKKDGKIFSPMASRLKSTESGTKQEKNEAAQMKQWDEAVESLDKVDENGHITIKDEDGGTTEVSYNPYGHCCVNSMMNDQFKRAWERDELYVMRVSAPESELTSGYHAEKAKDAVGIHKWKVGAVGRQLPEEKRREILLTRWMKNEEVMTWESVAEDWIKILDGEDVVVPFNVVPRKILNMIADAGVQIVAPENGMQKANKAYQQWLADPIGYVGDTELPEHVKALNEVEDDVRYRVDESLSDTVERMEQQSEQTNVADWMAKKNAVSAINGEMNQLRRAMSAQRKYDLTTVKAITRLAKEMLTNGMLDGTSQYSVKRILGAIERAHGKQDVSIEVKTLMDVMIDTQLQQSQKALKGMLSIKGSKVDAKGVEVQGKLDADGVAVVKAFKNAMGLPKESIENQIAEAMNRMGSRNEAVAADAANEYNGLMLALQYAEDITESKAEEKELRDSLKEARQDYEDGALSRDAYNELVRSTEDAIRQNKLERAEAYQDLISQVFGGVSESAERAKAWREAENERVNNIHHYANSDMEGRLTNEHHQDTLKQKLMNALASFVFAPMATFDQMLRMFGKKNRRGEGYLYNHFMGGWLKSAENEYLGYREALKELDAKVEAVFDGKIKRWGQLFSIDRKLGDVDVEFWDGGQMRPHTLTQGNLLYIYMVNKMADGQMKLRKMGITDEHVDAITRKLDPRFKQIADWLQEEFLVNKRNKYNEVHKHMFGASMASIDNYFPLKILANARIEKVDVGAETTEATLPSTATGSIIKRRKNNTALDLLNANAFSVILDHLKDMEHWAAFAEFNRDLNTLLSYKRFRNQVINITSVYGGGKQLWNEFRNVCALASGSYRPKTTKVDSFMLKAARGLSAAKVAGRIWTAIKQITSLPAFLSETNVITLSKNLSTPWIAWHWTMTNLPIAHKRWSSMTSGDPRLLQTKRDWADWQNRIGEISSHIGMAPNAFMDALSVSIGSYSVYESAKRKYIGYGYSESEAERKAMQAATIAFNQTQQSSEGAFLSTMQVDRTWLAQMFSVFRNNSFAYTRQLYDAIRGLANSLTTEEVEYMAKQMERDGIDPDKALVNAKKEVAKGTIRDLVRLMLFGGGLTYIWELMGNLPYLIFGDDDEKKEEMLDSAAQRAMLGGLDGLAGGEAIVEIALSAMTEEGTLRNVFKNGMPATSDIERALSKISSDQYSAFNDLVNIVAQYYAGINPQILIDAVVAIQDYCGDDAQTTRECALLIMRIIQCPQSQLDKVYFDEIDLSAEQASKLTPVQIAERYARYKRKRTSGGFDLLRTKEQADSAMTRKLNESLKLSKEAIGERLATDSTKILLEEYDAINERKREINKLREDMEDLEWQKLNGEFNYSYNHGKHKRIANYKKEMKDLTNRWLKTRSREEADSLVNEMFNVRNKMLQDIPLFDKAYQEWKERNE